MDGAPGDAERRETERRETDGLQHFGEPLVMPSAEKPSAEKPRACDNLSFSAYSSKSCTNPSTSPCYLFVMSSAFAYGGSGLHPTPTSRKRTVLHKTPCWKILSGFETDIKFISLR